MPALPAGLGVPGALETYLVYAPWRSLERALVYKVKVEEELIPGLRQQDLLDYRAARHPVPAWLADGLLNEIFGKEDTDGEAQG